MLLTESGMLTFSNDMHSKKVLLPMLVTVSGMLMFSKELHPKKALSRMLVTESGIKTFTSVWHHVKASVETSVTSGGIITPKKPGEFTSFLDAASILLLVYTTLTSDSASNPTSFNV